MTTKPSTLNVIALREGDHWIAQCLEYDIVAQSRSLERLPNSFVLAFASHLAVRAHHDQDPFEGVPEAPVKYWKMFADAKLRIESMSPPLPSSEGVSPGSIPILNVRAVTDALAA
ncbi:MAG: hypothetical protein MPJ22_06300 [Pirellulales bacterium]|nr:hypothetical protein [Alphaproteobacteria bacterium]MDA8042013.1 hypothetical protein [Pirellulales bacterium]